MGFRVYRVHRVYRVFRASRVYRVVDDINLALPINKEYAIIPIV